MRVCDQTPKAVLNTSFPKYRTNSFHLLGTVFTFRITLKQLSNDAISKILYQLKRFFSLFCYTARGEVTGKVKIAGRCGLTVEECRWAGKTYRQAASEPLRTFRKWHI
jgi:hypothetical protein